MIRMSQVFWTIAAIDAALLVVLLSIYRRWDLLEIAIELGASTTRARPDGRTVASELASQLNEASMASHEIPAELLRARAALEAGRRAP